MKVVLGFFMALLMANGCQEENLDQVELVYESMSRGLQKTITVKDSKLIHKEEGMRNLTQEKDLTVQQVKDLAALYQKIDLTSYTNLSGEKSERTYDGASHDNLIIKKEGVEYRTKGFDGGDPPAEIKGLVNKILQLSQK